MWLMDDLTICDVRAQDFIPSHVQGLEMITFIIYNFTKDFRIWQINSQNFTVRITWKTWFLDMGAFSCRNATYSIQFILMIFISSEKLMLPGRCTPVEFSVESAENWEKQQKMATPLLFDHSEQTCLVLYPETKYHTWITKSKDV